MAAEQAEESQSTVSEPNRSELQDNEDEEELLACASCFSAIIWRDDILQDKIRSCKEVVYPYELTVCDRESWCYLATDQQKHRFDLIRARQGSSVRLHASPRADFTWFPGYAWRSARCEECGASIGWGFCAPFQCDDGVSPTNSTSKLWNMAPDFLGLVLTRLRPCSRVKAQARHQQYRDSPNQHISYNFVVPPVELPPWWTRSESRGPNDGQSNENNTVFVDWLDEDPDAAFRRARSPTPPMRVGVRRSDESNGEDSDMNSELLRLLREQARVNRSLRMHQFGTPSNVQHTIPRLGDESVTGPVPGTPAPDPPEEPPVSAPEPETEAESNEASDSGLLRWLRRLLQSRRAREAPSTPREGTPPSQRRRSRENSPPNRTWHLIRQLSSQQQQLAAVRDSLLSEQLESSRHMQTFAEEHLSTHQRTLNQLRELSARQQQLASEQRQLMEDIIRLQGTVVPSQGQL